jgi:hypothetical protein
MQEAAPDRELSQDRKHVINVKKKSSNEEAKPNSGLFFGMEAHME